MRRVHPQPGGDEAPGPERPQRTDSYSEFFKGKLKVEGDLQYFVVYIDLLDLVSEISQEVGVVYNE